MNCMTILLSILLGLIPEGIFFAEFVIGAKKLKNHNRVNLCVLFVGIMVFAGILLSYSIWYYLVVTILAYLVLKMIDDTTEFIDLFLLTIPFLLLAVLGYPCYGISLLLPKDLPVNLITLILNRVLMIILLSVLYPKLNKWYNTYKRLWNVRAGNKIKSITVRNISILICNLIIIAAYYMLAIRM